MEAEACQAKKREALVCGSTCTIPSWSLMTTFWCPTTVLQVFCTTTTRRRKMFCRKKAEKFRATSGQTLLFAVSLPTWMIIRWSWKGNDRAELFLRFFPDFFFEFLRMFPLFTFLNVLLRITQEEIKLGQNFFAKKSRSLPRHFAVSTSGVFALLYSGCIARSPTHCHIFISFYW